MFSSRTREQIGCTCYMTDPSTWFHYGGAVEPGSQWEPNYECFKHFPHEQHNPTSPILESLRAGLEADPSADWFHTFLNTLPEWQEGSVGHARRVLTRLITLAKDRS